MSSTDNFVGIGEAQRVSSRVLKPPGGGSSISFAEDESAQPAKAPAKANGAPMEKQQEKAETNGMASPECVQEDATAATPKEPTLPVPVLNGTVTNGSVSNGTSSSTTSSPMTNGTPSSSRPSSNGAVTPTVKNLDTQNRLFGDEPRPSPGRRVRDHQRSSIFTDDNNSPKPVPTTPKSVYCGKWTRRDPVTGVGVMCWDIHAPRWAPNKRKASQSTPGQSPAATSPSQLPPQQRQRVPPGGFSTKLW